MPIWSEILQQINDNQGQHDAVRRSYLRALHTHTGRNTVMYASGWLQTPNVEPGAISLTDEDMQGLMEVTYGLNGGFLDIILHSPGGTPEAAEAVVRYLRSRFDNIRIIVPNLAMSAATMIACSAEEIVMGKHSFLGPTDPQLAARYADGRIRTVSAYMVIQQFHEAVEAIAEENTRFLAWQPVLSQFGPDLLADCDAAIKLTERLTRTWLASYMFREDATGEETAERVSTWLNDRLEHKSHARHLDRETLREKGLVIRDLEDDETLQDLALSVFHATTLTFTHTPATKIIENHLGRAFVKSVQPPPQIQIPQIQIVPQQAPPDIPDRAHATIAS